MSQTAERDHYDDVPLSALLRVARGTYARAVQAALAQNELDDLPANGSAIITAMHWSGASLESVTHWMGVTKQAVSQAVDTLVVRGYLERSSDRSDRRRVNLTLTDQGRAAGEAAQSAIERVDRELRRRVGARAVGHARAVLVALLEMDRGGRGRGRRQGSRSDEW